jgi:ribonuclease R/exosome complex exonuclease DIS3/RRP44
MAGDSPKRISMKKSVNILLKEELASKAERDSIKYMQVKYMQDHKDEIFDELLLLVLQNGEFT